MHPGLEAAAQELIDAVKRGDSRGVAMAFESAFAILELSEHEEYEEEEGEEE